MPGRFIPVGEVPSLPVLTEKLVIAYGYRDTSPRYFDLHLG